MTKAEEEPEVVGDPNNNSRRVIIMARHAERLDYVMRDKGENWIPTTDRPWDSPLSDSGLDQAQYLGKHVHKTLVELGLPPLRAVYSSPFQRCLQTAAGAIVGLSQNADINSPDLSIRVEQGLAESLNENWYRSWCLPESNGTWGLRPKNANGEPNNQVDVNRLHKDAVKPVQNLLQAQLRVAENDTTDPSLSSLSGHIDMEYSSLYKIVEPYSWGHFESRKDQRRRMHRVVEQLSEQHVGGAILCISHGGPVTHLYEELTGNHWSQHGESSYACFSIYIQEGNEWKPLLVNETTV